MQCISCKKQNKSLTRVSGQWVHYTASLLGAGVIFTESVGTPMSAAVSTNKILLWIVNMLCKVCTWAEIFVCISVTVFCICGLCVCWGQHWRYGQKTWRGGLWRLKFLWMTNGIIARKNLKITFFTDAPFIVKFRFEKYRYLLTHLLCLQIFEVLQLVPEMFVLLVPLPVLSDDTAILSPNMWWK